MNTNFAELLTLLLQNMVEDAGAVQVHSGTDDMGVLLTVHVAKQDMGKVLGREGATIAAIRACMRVVGMKRSARISIRVDEPAPVRYSYPENGD